MARQQEGSGRDIPLPQTPRVELTTPDILVRIAEKLRTTQPDWIKVRQKVRQSEQFKAGAIPKHILPGVLLEAHISTVLDEVIALEQDPDAIRLDPIQGEVLAGKYQFNPPNRQMHFTGNLLTRDTVAQQDTAEYDRILLVKNAVGSKTLLVVESKISRPRSAIRNKSRSSDLSYALSRENMERIFTPLKALAVADSELDIARFGFLAVTTSDVGLITGESSFKLRAGVLVRVPIPSTTFEEQAELL